MLRPVAKSLLTRNSYVHWPSPLFDEEMRQYRVNGEIVWVVMPRVHPQFRSDRTEKRSEHDGRPRGESIDDGEPLPEDPDIPVAEVERIIAEEIIDDSKDDDMGYCFLCFALSSDNLVTTYADFRQFWR